MFSFLSSPEDLLICLINLFNYSKRQADYFGKTGKFSPGLGIAWCSVTALLTDNISQR